MASQCKQEAPLRRQKSTRVDRNQQKSTNIAQKSTKVGRNRQKSSVVKRSRHSFNRNGSAVQGLLADHWQKHTYWNIKGCGDAARVFTGKCLFSRRKECGDFCSKCGTNVPPQVLPRFTTLQRFEMEKIYAKTQNRTESVASEQRIPIAGAEGVEAPGLPIRTSAHSRRVRT